MICEAVEQYATRFHRMLGGTHGVASPFGAWLLLALVGPAATGKRRSRLADALGCDPDEAFAAATRMLHDPHAELVLGAAVWHDPQVESEPLLDFLRRLAAHVDSGPIPDQSAADAWARDRTRGLIERFPLAVEPNPYPLVLLLATAIATQVTWQVPFGVVVPELAVLPAESGFGGVPLLMDEHCAAWSGFLETEAGLLAGFAAQSADGLFVTSAIGGPDAAPDAVLNSAQQLAIAVATGSPPSSLSLFELPLGDGPAWRITEANTDAREIEHYEWLLPAWRAHSDHDLRGVAFGFADAGPALIELLPRAGYKFEARQSAMASYRRAGFAAAAVTSIGARVVSAVGRPTRRTRTARVELTRPHAVVAATKGDGDWDGLPVFSAWVAEAVPAE